MGNCAAGPPKQTKQVSPAYLSVSSQAGVCPRPHNLGSLSHSCTEDVRLRVLPYFLDRNVLRPSCFVRPCMQPKVHADLSPGA